MLLINLESKHSQLMKFGQFMSYYLIIIFIKRNIFIKKFNKKCGMKTSSRPFCFQRIEHKLHLEMKFSKESTYIGYVITKLSKLVKISMLTSSDSFLLGILQKLQRGWT